LYVGFSNVVEVRYLLMRLLIVSEFRKRVNVEEALKPMFAIPPTNSK